MRIEKFYYTEYKVEQDKRVKELWARLQQEIVQQQEEGDKTIDGIEKNQESSEQHLVVYPAKYHLFAMLAQLSIRLAKSLRANLLAYTDEYMSGWIIFVGAAMHCRMEKDKKMLKELVENANSVHISVSMDTGEGSPTDVNGAVQVAFRFDFYIELSR